MESKNIFHKHEILPVYFSLFGDEVVTLYGCGLDEEENDILLMKDGHLIFFDDDDSLIKFIVDEIPCNFSESCRYKEFAVDVKHSLWDYEFSERAYDLHRLGELLRAFRYQEWTAAELNLIVEGLNMLQDASYTLKDDIALSFFFRQEAETEFPPLNLLLAETTFFDPRVSEKKLALPTKIDPKIVYSHYSELVGRICLRSMIYEEPD